MKATPLDDMPTIQRKAMARIKQLQKKGKLQERVEASRPVGKSRKVPGKVTHEALATRAVAWLLGTCRCKVAISELVTACREVPDAIGWRHGGHSILVECKTSRRDFLNEQHKGCERVGRRMGDERWYFAPAGVLHPSDMPPGWGLLELRGDRVYKLVSPTKHSDATPVTKREELVLMTSAMARMVGTGEVVGVRCKILAYEPEDLNNGKGEVHVVVEDDACGTTSSIVSTQS